MAFVSVKSKNILFGICGGWVPCLYFSFLAAVYAVTVIGAKKAYALIKLAYFCVTPFGKIAHLSFASHKFGNAWWAATTGWQAALVCVLFALLTAVTVIGLPFAKRYFMLAQYAVSPFGAKWYPTTLLTGDERAVANVRQEVTDYEI